MSTDAMGYIIAGLAGLVSFLGFKTTFPLVKFGASILWIAAFMYFQANAPAGTEGQPWHLVFILAAVVMIIAIPLAQLGRDVEKHQGFGNAFNMKSVRWQWGKGDAPEPKRGLNESLDDYRTRVAKALRRMQ